LSRDEARTGAKSEIRTDPSPENIVVTHYWVTAFWADKAGKGEPPETTRITHTWMKTAAGWQILGGMSCPPASGK
jgi:hypothetical protein